MKRIGLVGGIGPESTVDYYQSIIRFFHDRKSEEGYPEIIVYSGNLSELLRMLKVDDWNGLTSWLVDKVSSLHSSGAEFAAICSNTPHIVFDQVQKRSPIPLLSIVDATLNAAKKMKIQRVGLIGTKFTMSSHLYSIPFSEAGMKVSVPEEEDQELVQRRLFEEIELGILKDSTRKELLKIVKKMVDTHNIEAVILGCTELPLILTKDEFGISFLNTTAIHARSIVEYCLGSRVP